MFPPFARARPGALPSSVRATGLSLVLFCASAARADEPAQPPAAVPANAAPATAVAGAPPAVEPAALSASEAPPCVFERYISVAAGAGFDAHLAEEVRKDLAAELAPRGFGVCPGRAAQGELVAAVTLVLPEPALVAIQVEDRATGKRVARDVRLSRIPAGGVALAIAIAADELLRASWAELMLRRTREQGPVSEPEPELEPSPANLETRHFVRWRKRREPVPAAVAIAIDYGHSLKHWDGFSLSLRLQLRPFRYGLFELGGGGVLALPVKTEFGTVQAAGALALLTLGACGEPRASVALCGGARGTFQWTQFRGSDAQRAEASRRAATSLALSAVAQAQLRVTAHFIAFAELSLGAAPVAAVAYDRDGARQGTLVGIQGLLIGAALGAGYAP